MDFQVVIPSHPNRPRYATYNSLLPLGEERLLHVRGYPLAYARNKGIALAGADVIVQTDDDAEIPPDYVEWLVSLVKPRRFVMMEVEDPLILAGYRRDFIALGGFDERIRPYLAEDLEFKWRVMSCGYDVLYIPKDERMHHYGGLRKPWSRKELIAAFNMALAFVRYKNPESEDPLLVKLAKFFVQWKGGRSLTGWRSIVPWLSVPFWLIAGRIGKRNSFGW